MISKAMFNKTHGNPQPFPTNEPAPPSPYIVPSNRRAAAQRHPSPPVRHSIIQTRAHRGLKLVATPRPARPASRRFWSGWLDQKHLDRGFLFLAASSALLLLLSSR